MLWKYSMPYSGYIDAPADIVAARNALIERMRADPASFISKLEPAEPSVNTMLDLGKRVLGIK